LPSTIELDQSDPVVGQVAGSVPCISSDKLMGGGCEHLVEVIRSACTETGFFFVDLASSQCNAIAATLFQMEGFFSISDCDPRKQNACEENRDYGWVPKYSEPAYQPGTVSCLEAFDFGLANVEDADMDIWPELPRFRADLTDCWAEFTALSDAILDVVARAAQMEPNFLFEQCDSRALNTMRLLHYAADTAAGTNDEVGIAAHTDFECITLLYQTASGLELLDVNGRWLDAPARDGRIVVLLGDMLERWTNGQFKATGHRVRKTAEQRFSIVLFVAANEDIEIAPQPQFVAANVPACYAPITQAEHIENEVRRAKENAAYVNGPNEK
jgi:isopenicillin N synthase-like dioxygenase